MPFNAVSRICPCRQPHHLTYHITRATESASYSTCFARCDDVTCDIPNSFPPTKHVGPSRVRCKWMLLSNIVINNICVPPALQLSWPNSSAFTFVAPCTFFTLCLAALLSAYPLETPPKRLPNACPTAGGYSGSSISLHLAKCTTHAHRFSYHRSHRNFDTTLCIALTRFTEHAG